MLLKHRLVTILGAAGVAISGLGLAAPTHVLAGTGASQSCNDGDADDVSLLTTPITLGLQVGVPVGSFAPDAGAPQGVALCYSTTDSGNSNTEITGGMVQVSDLTSGCVGCPVGFGATCLPDANPEYAALGCEAMATAVPAFAVTPGPRLMVAVPFVACAGSCTTGSANVGPTGVIIGTVSPISEPGTGEGLTLSAVTLYVNGIQMLQLSDLAVGAFVDPSSGGVSESIDPSNGGPCLEGVCVPYGSVKTTSQSPVLGVQIPLLPPFTLTLPANCIYANPSTQC